MTYHTPASIAALLGCPLRTVQQRCQELDLPRHGKSYLIREPSPAFDRLKTAVLGRRAYRATNR